VTDHMGTLGMEPPSAGYTEDVEIQVIRECLAQLNKLSVPIRSRVLRYLTDRLGQ
jgi:hypothetical protein